MECETSSINDNKKIRATSFDLIFFLIPKEWDSGKGFDYSMNALNAGYYSPTPIDPKRLVSTDGCNWFQRKNLISYMKLQMIMMIVANQLQTDIIIRL